MKRILIVGCGDVALRTIPLLTKHYRVYALVRNPAYCAGLRRLGVVPLIGDLDDRASLARIKGLADAVLHFAPPVSDPSLPPFGKGGRVDIRTRNLLSVLSQAGPDKTTSHSTKLSKNDSQVAGYELRRSRAKPVRLVYISTSGVYGDCGGDRVSETRPVNPGSARSKLRVDAERQIREWAIRNQVNATILRVPGIYAAERLPVSRLQQPCIVDAEDGYTNHIHADDLARISVAAMQRGKPCRVYHASDDSQMKMGEYFDAVADGYGLPHPPRLPRVEVQRAVSPMMYSFMNESRRLTNSRIKRELKVRLKYPTVADCLLEMMGQK
ncbi:MAG: SDR family oxidoreductase [Gallionella sp.]|jgi:nucleoside-diphosphate-sugar epimerase